ncbi:MAG: NYN domain-containing protein [Chloroflexi bacterium]|nr:NYN domain-containing protein [Chloroflexota bacterium]
MTDRSKTVVMLIDWDNLQICHSRDAPGTDLDLQALIALAQSYGTLVTARAYAEWNLLSERLAVYRAGIEPVFAPVMRPENSPREGKSLADTVMVADGVDLLWTVAPDVFVLATSDKDMIPLARIAKQRGAAVVVLGSDLTAIPLVEMSNVFITYRQLLRELDRVGELEAPVGRAPARERRLRESRRPAGEPFGSASGVPTGAHNFSGASSFGGASGFGSGGRAGGRSGGSLQSPVGPSLGAGVAPPPRRVQPVAPPAEIASALTVTTVPSSVSTGVDAADDTADASGTSLGEPGARRRRRRGGRGRRTGLAGGAEGEASSVTTLPHDDEAEDDTSTEATAEIRPAPVVPPSPDDLDDAVLKLLAARDRDAAAPSAEPILSAPTAAETEPEPTAPAFVSPATFDTADEPPPTPRKRIARTSFGAFGPRESSARPLGVPPSEPVDAVPMTPAEPAAIIGQPAAEPAEGIAEPNSEPATPAPDEALASPAPTAEAGVSGEAAAADNTSASANASAAEPSDGSAEAATADAPARARSGRSGRSSSGRRVRRPASPTAGESAAAPVAEAAASPADAAPATPPRRRRTRQAVREAAASSESAGTDSAASEAGA